MVTYRPTYTSVAQSNGTTLTLTKPTSALPGDWLLAGIQCDGGTNQTITPHSDWERVLRQDDSTDESLSVYKCRVVAESPATWAFTMSGQAAVAIVLAYGGVDPVAAIDVSGSQANASSASMVAPAVVTTKTDAFLVFFGGGAAGQRTATPPSGMTERADVQGAALSLEVADVKQRTLGSSGTKTATLSSAQKNIGVLVALCPGALNTPADARDEGNWSIAGWERRFTTEAQVSAYFERVLQRANTDLRSDLPGTAYAANVLLDPWYTLFAQAEMDRAQELLLRTAAAMTETSDDDQPAVFMGTASEMLKAAASKAALYQALLDKARAECGSTAPTNARACRGLVTARRGSTARVLENFDRDHGTDVIEDGEEDDDL